MEHEGEFVAGVNTHEAVIFNCFGGMSNTGITAALASLEAVKEVGLDKACIGCLAGLPTEVDPVFAKVKAAKRVVTVDGCPFECSRKLVEASGIRPTASIMLVRDVPMSKKALHEDIGRDLKPATEYIDDGEVQRAKELIVKAVMEEGARGDNSEWGNRRGSMSPSLHPKVASTSSSSSPLLRRRMLVERMPSIRRAFFFGSGTRQG